MKKSRLVFIALFAIIALALSVSAAGATDTSSTTQPPVKLWAFYDKDANAYPTGWWYLDPVITDPSAWQQDSDWLPFPSPHYALYGGTWGSDTMGALIQEGDFGPGVAEIPLADGLYWVVLSAPPGNWQLTTDSVQKVYVWNGNVYVQWANEGLWYGDKVLVGIIDGASGCGTLYPNVSGAYVNSWGCGFTPNFYVDTWVEGPNGYFDGVHTHGTDSSGCYYGCSLYLGPGGNYTLFAQDATTGCIATRDFYYNPPS